MSARGRACRVSVLLAFSFAGPESLRSTVTPHLPKMYLLEPLDTDTQADSVEKGWESKALDDLTTALTQDESLKGVAIDQGSGSDQSRMEKDGAELLAIKVEQVGDDLHFILRVRATLHASKPYPVRLSSCKASEGAGKCLDHHLADFTSMVQTHHKFCHVEGACS